MTTSETKPTRLMHTASQALEILPFSRSKLYELTGSGEIESVKLHGRRFWTDRAIRDFVARLEGQA